jgi:hypothetical protein
MRVIAVRILAVAAAVGAVTGTVLGPIATAEATDWTYEFGGRVDMVNAPEGLWGVSVRDTWKVTCVFDWPTTNIEAFSFEVGGRSFATTGVDLGLWHDPSQSFDFLTVDFSAKPTPSYPDWFPWEIELVSGWPVFSNYNVPPLQPPPIEVFIIERNLKLWPNGDGNPVVWATVFYWTPEPASLMLLAFGGLAVMRWRRS